MDRKSSVVTFDIVVVTVVVVVAVSDVVDDDDDTGDKNKADKAVGYVVNELCFLFSAKRST